MWPRMEVMEMDGREQRGMEIAATTKLRRKGSVWVVPSQGGKGDAYAVDLGGETPTCSCPDHETRRVKCKHIYAVEFSIRRETTADGTTTVTKTVRVTDAQDWPAYNAAQTHEKERGAEISNCPTSRWESTSAFAEQILLDGSTHAEYNCRRREKLAGRKRRSNAKTFPGRRCTETWQALSWEGRYYEPVLIAGKLQKVRRAVVLGCCSEITKSEAEVPSNASPAQRGSSLAGAGDDIC